MEKKPKILVTGGTGYIGSHTVIELLTKEYEVLVLDNLSNSYEWILDRIEIIAGKKPDFFKIDLTNKQTLDDFFSNNTDIEGVIHFAAFKAVGESVENPNKYYYNNLLSLINLIDCMNKYGISNLIFSSSCTVYGEPSMIPIKEDAEVVKAASPYGNTKKIAEEILFDNTQVSNLKVIALRYFNPVGAHESGLIGELPINKPQSLMPVITQTCIGKQEKMFVHGTDYPTPDGTAIRDYFHVSDLAKAHLMALDYLINCPNPLSFDVFNLGSEKGYSVFEVIKAFEKANKIKVNYIVGPRRSGDITKIWADSSKAFNAFGWKTEKSLIEMVTSAWKWECNLKELAK